MKNYFIVHALGRTAEDYWYKSVKKQIENNGHKCFVPTMPDIEHMSYASWEKEFDKFLPLINQESVFIGHSTGAIFIVNYLMKHNLKIDKYISVVGFNKENINSANIKWDEINKTFFVNNLDDFKNYANERVSFYSPTDIYDFKILDEFATAIEAEKVIIENAGHFTKGYENKFEEILKFL